MMGHCRRLSRFCSRAGSLCVMIGLLCGQCALCMDNDFEDGDDLRSWGADGYSCPPGWVALHRACYRFVSQPARSWEDARRDCEQVGAQLLSIGPMGELIPMKKQLRKLDAGKSRWWVGLHKNRTSWHWLDGGAFNVRITRWIQGEPNNKKGNEDCVEMDATGQINDEECDEAFRPYICEKQPGRP